MFLSFFSRKFGFEAYLLGETEEYQDQSRDILNSISNEDVLLVLSDSDSEEPLEELWTNKDL